MPLELDPFRNNLFKKPALLVEPPSPEPLLDLKDVLRERLVERHTVKFSKKSEPTPGSSTHYYFSPIEENAFYNELKIPYGMCNALVTREADLKKRKRGSPFHNTVLSTRSIDFKETFLHFLAQPMPEESNSYSLLLDDNGIMITNEKVFDLKNFSRHLRKVLFNKVSGKEVKYRAEVLESARLLNRNSMVIYKDNTAIFKNLRKENDNKDVIIKKGSNAIMELPDVDDYKNKSPYTNNVRSNSKDLILIFKEKDCDMKTFMKSMVSNGGSLSIDKIGRDRGVRFDLVNEKKSNKLFNKDNYIITIADVNEGRQVIKGKLQNLSASLFKMKAKIKSNEYLRKSAIKN